jgi:hypothetical protein
MKKLLLAICLLFIFQQSEAQEKQKFDPQFYTLQDSLKSLSFKIVNDQDELIRRNCTFTFIKTLVSALKLPNSFAFPFDSVVSISIMRSPDNQFRIFTWHLRTDDGHYRYYGAIQKNDPNKLSLYPLFDNSAFIQNPQDTILTNDSWYGAHYYTIIVPKRWFSKNKKYVLLGWKGHNQNSQQKVIDVLSFAKNGSPIFGAANLKLKDKT